MNNPTPNLTIKELFKIVDSLNEDELRQELKARIVDIDRLTKGEYVEPLKWIEATDSKCWPKNMGFYLVIAIDHVVQKPYSQIRYFDSLGRRWLDHEEKQRDETILFYARYPKPIVKKCNEVWEKHRELMNIAGRKIEII